MIAGHGEAVTHYQFIARTADPDEIDAAGALFFGQLKQFRRITGNEDGLGYDGVVAVGVSAIKKISNNKTQIPNKGNYDLK
jgi:hypothetical protein